MDCSWSYSLPEVLISQRRVELRDCNVGGDVLWWETILGDVQPGCKYYQGLICELLKCSLKIIVTSCPVLLSHSLSRLEPQLTQISITLINFNGIVNLWSLKTWPSVTKTLTSFLPWIKAVLQRAIAACQVLMLTICGFHPNPWESASDMQVDAVLNQAINQNLREYWNYSDDKVGPLSPVQSDRTLQWAYMVKFWNS